MCVWKIPSLNSYIWSVKDQQCKWESMMHDLLLTYMSMNICFETHLLCLGTHTSQSWYAWSYSDSTCCTCCNVHNNTMQYDIIFICAAWYNACILIQHPACPWPYISLHVADEDPDYCATNPCGTNGVCTPTEGGYTCSCASGFTGEDCLDRKS